MTDALDITATDNVPEVLHIAFSVFNGLIDFSGSEEIEYLPEEYDLDWCGDGSPKIMYSELKKRGGRTNYPMPSSKIWRQFRERIEALGIFEWKSRPIEGEDEMANDWMPPAWYIKIIYPDKEIDIRGPMDKLPPNDTSELGPELRQFFEAVSSLIEGHPFGAVFDKPNYAEYPKYDEIYE